MELFRDWYLVRHLGLALSRSQQHVLEDAFGILIRSARAQPQVWVHRDYHSRNLLVTGQNNPGIVDFQDAVRGPVTYDLVSLLRDCYIAWPRARVEDWVKGYHDLARQSGIPAGEDDVQFLKWFDLMGVQRHLKASGIFARLHHRDGKPGYLADIPRTLGYVLEVAARQPELEPLLALLRALHVPQALTPAAAGVAGHEGDDPGRRPWRAHAPAERPRPEAAAAGGGQGAGRAPDRAARACRPA